LRIAIDVDKALIERIVNHPELRKFNAHDGAPPCDAGRYLKAPSFVVLVDGGCFLAHCVGPCRYSVHTNLLPECRGRDALRVARATMDMVFAGTDTEELYTMVPENNPQAAWFACAMGFRFRFKRERVWRQAGVDHDMRYYSMTVDDWVLRGRCQDQGIAFHQALHAKAPELEQHAADPVHECYVGAAVEMMKAGQLVKAISLYNRFARFSGYATIKVMSKDPLVVDIQNAVLTFRDGDFTCQKPVLR
jgi:hypothetical protein